MKPAPLLFLLVAACLGDVEVPPDPPTLAPVTSPTTIPTQTLSGSKVAGTAVLLSDQIAVPHDDATNWSFIVSLQPGENRILLGAQHRSGLASRRTTEAVIVFDPPCPGSPSLASLPARTASRSVMLRGSKPAFTSIWSNDSQIVPSDELTEWTYALELPDRDGPHPYEITARDSKDRDSDPVRFTIALDRAPPAIAFRYPAIDELRVPTNAIVSLTFDGELEIEGVAPDPGTVMVRAGGQEVPGFLEYRVLSRTIVWTPMTGALAPDTEHQVTVDPMFVRDLAGNAAQGLPDWSYAFTSSTAPLLDPPAPPTLMALPASVTTDVVPLEGTKAAMTSIEVNGEEVVPIDGRSVWSYELPLPVGTSSISVLLRSVARIVSALPPLTIERTLQRPSPPAIDTSVPEEVMQPKVTLLGTRPADTSVLLDGNVIACRSPDATWSYEASLAPGVNDLTLTTRDAMGVQSDPVVHTVAYVQLYEGPVPNGFVLAIELTLRDLSQVSEIRGEFVTGPNNYGVEAWVEGPIALDETCVMAVNRQRQNIKYVATIQNYIGTKAQHTVPYADDDYRGADYLAAMISGGVFAYRGLNAGSVRRDPDGKEVAGLLSGITEADIRTNVDCFGAVGVDACTNATAPAGLYRLEPWTPRQRGGQGLLDQGDYLLFIQLQLDRDGSWLSANDYETCWDDPLDRGRGMHRIVQRISLGPTPYELVVPQAEELSGPDREGAGLLRYVAQDGLVIRWGPNQ